MGVKDRQRKQRRQRQKKAIWQGNGQGSVLSDLANEVNTNIQCAWCGEPASLYASLEDGEPTAMGLRIGSLYVAIHHECMEAAQTALRHDAKTAMDRLSRFPAPDLFGELATDED